MNGAGRTLIGSLVSVVALSGVAGTVAAQAPQIVVDLTALSDSGVEGSAVVAGLGSGTTVDLGLRGLDAGTEYAVSLHAGACEAPSASTALIATAVAAPNGTATPGGEVLFQDRDPVAFETVADGEHVLIVSGPGGAVACAVLGPSAEPATAGSPAPAASGNAGMEASPVESTPLMLIIGAFAGIASLMIAARRLGLRGS